MAIETTDKPIPEAMPPPRPGAEVPFGVNEMRLNARQWLITAAIMLILAVGLPLAWKHFERFETGPDYRIPYALSSDYWLYQRRVERLTDPNTIPVIGDSVVWGEYVRNNGTLSHFLSFFSSEAGRRERFANCGVNGVYPLALDGLIGSYGKSIHDRKVIVQCNLLWMSSPKADLSIRSEETFDHPTLVPQFGLDIPCYKADSTTRLGAIAERNVELSGWVKHVDICYFDQLSVPEWTLEESGDPPRATNAWRNPFSRIKMEVPGEPANDPQRGTLSARHKPWNANGAQPTHFEWVPLAESLQWRGFQRLIKTLRNRGNDVMVILGPFNEHLIAEDQRPTYESMRAGVAAWLAANHINHVVPETLATDLYADASHPLTQGYVGLAREIYTDPTFSGWLNAP